jgi:transcriptional regulator with XRE-family HTH domain
MGHLGVKYRAIVFLYHVHMLWQLLFILTVTFPLSTARSQLWNVLQNREIRLEKRMQKMEESNMRKTIKAPICANERLKSEREKRGWTRDYVAGKIGSDTHTIGRWERGATTPSPYYRQKLCELFGMNAEELGFFKDEVKDSPELHPVQGVQPHEKTSAKTEHDIVGTNKAPSPQIVLGYRDLLGYIVTGIIVIIVSAILLATFSRDLLLPSFSFPSRSTPGFIQIRPGGAWINPANGSIVHDTMLLAAKAYPTHPGDPLINHVNFTAGWNGTWGIGCTAYPPTNDNTFACIANLLLLNAPAGRIRISFDVYDQVGNVNLAPNGIHAVFYE